MGKCKLRQRAVSFGDSYAEDQRAYISPIVAGGTALDAGAWREDGGGQSIRYPCGGKNLCEKFCGLKIVRIFVLTILLNKFVSNEKYSGRTDKT